MSAAVQVIPSSLSKSYQKLLTTNSTDGTFPARVDTVTNPAAATPGGVGAFDVAPSSPVPNSLSLLPFGAGAAGNTFDMRVIGWRSVGGLYVPTILWQGTCTLSTSIGVAGQPVTATDRHADIIGAPAVGTEGVTCRTVSPANNTNARVLVDLEGHQTVEVVFDMGTATSGNALYALSSVIP